MPYSVDKRLRCHRFDLGAVMATGEGRENLT